MADWTHPRWLAIWDNNNSKNNNHPREAILQIYIIWCCSKDQGSSFFCLNPKQGSRCCEWAYGHRSHTYKYRTIVLENNPLPGPCSTITGTKGKLVRGRRWAGSEPNHHDVQVVSGTVVPCTNCTGVPVIIELYWSTIKAQVALLVVVLLVATGSMHIHLNDCILPISSTGN